MRKLIIALAMLHLAMAPAVAQESPAAAVVMNFYGALKTGDVDALQSLIGEPLSSQYHVLLTQNSEYPEFLRARYDGSSGAIVASSGASGGASTVDFEVNFKDGNSSILRFHLQGQDDGSWKIVEEERVN